MDDSSKKGRDARFTLGSETIKKINALSKKHNLTQSAVLRMAIDSLFAKKNNSVKRDFISKLHLEYVKYLVKYCKIDIKSKRKIVASLQKIQFKEKWK